MYVMGMEKVLSTSYAVWKKDEKRKDNHKNNHRGPRKGLPVGLSLSLNCCPALG